MINVFSLIAFLFGILFSANSLADYYQSYPVKWTNKIKLNRLAEIPNFLNRQNYPEAIVHYVNNQNEQAVAKTCQDYFNLVKKGYYPANNTEISAESFFKLNCDSIAALFHAKPAQISYLRSFNLKNDYKLLPAALIFPSLGDAAQPTHDLQTDFPDTSIERYSSNSITLVSKKANMRTIINILGWGDFNNTRYDEMLIFVANYVLDGTYHSYDTILLKKDGENAIIKQTKLP